MGIKVSFILWVLSVTYCFGSEFDPSIMQPLDIINEARSKNGLFLLKYSERLSDFAGRHVDYLSKNKVCSHYQDNANAKSFSGFNLKERADNFGYSYSYLSENLFCGMKPDWSHAISSLMGAIYHRAAFLSPKVDNIGYKMQSTANLLNILKDPMPYKFVFEMSRSKQHTTNFPFAHDVPDINNKQEKGFDFKDGNYHQLLLSQRESTSQQALVRNPSVVVYPFPNQDNVPRVFLDDELPDPTPNLTISGLPISAHFNPNLKAEIVSFTLNELANKEQQIPVWSLDESNDINKKMQPDDYAWFPIKPLKPDTLYEVTLIYRESSIHSNDIVKNFIFGTERERYPNLHTLSKRDGNFFHNGKETFFLKVQSPDPSKTAWVKKIQCVGCNRSCVLKVKSYDVLSIDTSASKISCSVHFKDQAEKMEFSLKKI